MLVFFFFFWVLVPHKYKSSFYIIILYLNMGPIKFKFDLEVPCGKIG